MQLNKNVARCRQLAIWRGSSQRICSLVSVLLTSFRGECIQGCSHTWIDWRRCSETRGHFPRWLGSWAEITHKRWSWLDSIPNPPEQFVCSENTTWTERSWFYKLGYFCVRCPASGKCAHLLAAPWLILLSLSSVSWRRPTKSDRHAWGSERKALPVWCVLWPTLQYGILNTKWPKGNMQIAKNGPSVNAPQLSTSPID